MSNQPISPPPIPDSPTAQGGGVRRHHTISASSRAAHAGSRTYADESQHGWDDDEVVDQDWVGTLGAVGDKSNLHRQASLPTRYNRRECLIFPFYLSFISGTDLHSVMKAFARSQNRQGTLTPRNMNSLSAIAAEQAQEGEEEEWEREMRGWNGEDEVRSTASVDIFH